MSIEQNRLEEYARKRLLNTGRFTTTEIDKIVLTILSLKTMQSESAINAFLQAAKI